MLTIQFVAKEIMADLMTTAYYEFLENQDINLEKVIEWFFSNYLNQEYKVESFYTELPSERATYSEKCRDIFPEIEYVLLQFKNYVEYGFINHELLEISSSGISYNQIPSLVEQKYVYPGKLLNTVFHYLFSDQSGLGYLGDLEKDSSTFFELILNHDVSYTEFHSYQKEKVKDLIDLGYIKIDINGFIRWTNPIRIKVLYELYYNEVVSYYRMQSKIRDEIDSMLEEGLVYFESSLFSKPEQDYFNYYLNNSKFQNGPRLRNRYTHGTLGSRPNIDESTHEKNYLVALKLLMLIVLKINEDFALYGIEKENRK